MNVRQTLVILTPLVTIWLERIIVLAIRATWEMELSAQVQD